MRSESLAVVLFVAVAFMQEPAAQTFDQPALAPDKPVSIPFELLDNLVTVEAVVNGRKQRAVLDSGAAALIVDQGFARNAGLGEGASVGEAGGAGEQAQQLRPVELASLVVGPLRFDRLPGYSVNLEQLSSSAGFPVNLLVGAPAFKYGAVTVDYRRNLVTFGASGSAGKCAVPIPITIVYGVPVVEVELRHTPDAKPVRLKLVVDLGTRHRAMSVGGPFVRSETGKAMMRSGVSQQVGHGIGGEVQGSIARVAELRLGQTRITNMEVALMLGAPAFEAGVVDGTLGVPFWKDGAITFDYQANSLCIAR
jgi:hypothetical protein